MRGSRVPPAAPVRSFYSHLQAREHNVETHAQIIRSLQEVKKLDFRKLKRYLREKRGWSTGRANAAEALYRNFLALKMVFRRRFICPTNDIYVFWQTHILDTRAYEGDCRALFGQYLHHYPYLGMDKYRAAYEKAFGETRALFIEHFGVDPCASNDETHEDSSRLCA